MRWLRIFLALVLSSAAAYGGGWLAHFWLTPRPLEIIALPESDKKFWRFDNKAANYVGQMTMPLIHDPDAKHLILCAEPEGDVERFSTNRNMEIDVHQLNVETKTFEKPIPQVVTAGTYRKLPSGQIWGYCAKVIESHKNLPGCSANNFIQISDAAGTGWTEDLCQWSYLVPGKATISIIGRRFHDRIEIVDATTGKTLRRLEIPTNWEPAYSPNEGVIWAISDDEKRIAVSILQRSTPAEYFIAIYDTETGKLSQKLTTGIPEHKVQFPKAGVLSLAFAGNGKLVTQFGEPRIHFQRGITTPGEAQGYWDLATGQFTPLHIPNYYDDKGTLGQVRLLAASEDRAIWTSGVESHRVEQLTTTPFKQDAPTQSIIPNQLLNRMHYLSIHQYLAGPNMDGIVMKSLGQKSFSNYEKYLKYLPDGIQRLYLWDHNVQNTVSWFDTESGDHWVVRNHGTPSTMRSGVEFKIHAKILRDKLYILAPDATGTTQLEVWSTPPPRPVSMWKVAMVSAFAGLAGLGLSSRLLFRRRKRTSEPPVLLA